jgi:hypothetical protein
MTESARHLAPAVNREPQTPATARNSRPGIFPVSAAIGPVPAIYVPQQSRPTSVRDLVKDAIAAFARGHRG